MSTFKDVMFCADRALSIMENGGCSGRFALLFYRKLGVIASTISKENGIPENEVKRLGESDPESVVLGEESEDLFNSFKEWLKKNGERFSEI